MQHGLDKVDQMRDKMQQQKKEREEGEA